jgi:hypothetical protein
MLLCASLPETAIRREERQAQNGKLPLCQATVELRRVVPRPPPGSQHGTGLESCENSLNAQLGGLILHRLEGGEQLGAASANGLADLEVRQATGLD